MLTPDDIYLGKFCLTRVDKVDDNHDDFVAVNIRQDSDPRRVQ